MPAGYASRQLSPFVPPRRSRVSRAYEQAPNGRAPRKFKPVKLNVARFDNAWERKRGAAVRLTAVLLREDDSTLERRVCENELSAKTYADAMAWLRRESIHLRKVAKLLDTAGGRLAAVLTRCQVAQICHSSTVDS
jgi:hypothetical protein